LTKATSTIHLPKQPRPTKHKQQTKWLQNMLPKANKKQTNQPKNKTKQNKPIQTKNLTKQPNSFSPLSFVGCT
jgi:hypothetical protein